MIDLNALVADFEGAISTDNAAGSAETDSQVKFDNATAALANAKSAHVQADAAVFATGQALISGIGEIIAPFAPVAPPPAE